MDKLGRWRKNITVNQITWQVGSLAEVVNGHKWMVDNGVNVVRAGRDMPGSNWHVYVMDPDLFQNELYYGIEQIGWQGNSKPWDMHDRQFRDIPELPQKSERQEVEDAKDRGVDLVSGFRDSDPLPETYDVQGTLLARPFKIVGIGPVRLFVTELEAAVGFYRDTLGFIVTEEVDYRGHRCVYLRNNTEHHSLALYPIALRQVLGLSETTTLMSFGVRLANYAQLRDAKAFLEEHGVELRDFPPELTLGIDRSIVALDGNGHAIELYHGIEQIGWDGKPRPAGARRKGAPGEWPEAIEPTSDSYMGEPFLGPWG
ncbi:MAG: VOC family protein [Proteobacteria bacterium]|nr:VOC family protein [Pseudomonadota bacterium]